LRIFPFSSVCIVMMCFGGAAILCVRFITPSSDEVQLLAEDLLAQEFTEEEYGFWDDGEDVLPKLLKCFRDNCVPRTFALKIWDSLQSGFRQLIISNGDGGCQNKCLAPACHFMVRQQYRTHHFLIILVLGFVPAYCTVFQTAAVGYVMPETDLLKDVPFQIMMHGMILAIYIGFLTFIMNTFVPPIVAKILDQKPAKAFKKLIWLNVPLLLTAWICSLFRLWTTQMIMFACTAYIQALHPYLLSQHIYAYAPINMIGPTTTALAVPMLLIYLLTQHSTISKMEGITKFPFDPSATFLDVALISPLIRASMFIYFFYAIFFSWRGSPKVPPLLPEDETNRCLAYGCKNPSEVALVMDMDEKEGDDPQICLFYNTTEEQNTLVCTMIADNMKENMENLPKGNLKWAINKGFIWQSNVEPEIHRSKLGYGIVAHPELQRFGLRKPKKVDLDDEEQKKKAKKKKEKETKDFNSRVVDILSIRMVWAHGEHKNNPIILVETAEKPPDGPPRTILQYPNLKMYNAESVTSACDRLLEECGGWDELSAIVDYSSPSLHKETFESPSYPGMVTVYQRHIVEVTLHEQPPEMIERLAGIGLPGATPFERQASKSQRNVMVQLEWLTEAQVQQRDPKFVLKGQEKSAGSGGRRKTLSNLVLDKTKEDAANQNDRLPSSVAAPLKAIVQNCNTRTFTKHLVRLIRNGDKAALEEWIQGEEREYICHAFKDMHVWTGPDAAGLFTQFFSMIPWSQLAEMSTQSKSVKAVVLDLLTTDLKKTQSELDDVIEFERQVWAGELEVNQSDPLDVHLPKDSIVARRKARVLRMHHELTNI